MAGGSTTPELVTAVTGAGALGSFGLAYSSASQIHTQCQAFRALCARRGLASDCGWNANFFVFPEITEPSNELTVAAKAQMAGLAQRVGVDANELSHETQLPDLLEQVTAALAYQPSLVSFHLGIPDQPVIDLIRQTHCLIAMSATSLREAEAVAAAGADFIVAQGHEAGGHRGIFDLSTEDEALGTLELVTSLATKCQTPLIAAGGIMDSAGITAALKAGADAVQLGSAFLTVDECGTSEVYRAAISTISNRGTHMTTGFSGRPARGIRNLFIDTVQADAVLPFPLQNTLTGKLRKAAAVADDHELMSLWAGVKIEQAQNCSAAELIQQLRQTNDL